MHDGHIYLVRHGEAAAKWGENADPSLSALGRQQAESARDQLLPRLESHSTRLISSPLARAQETAAPLRDALDLPLAIDERFREIPAPVPLPERQRWLRRFMQRRWDEEPDDGVHHWREMLLAALEGLAPGSVVFTHFLVINTAVGALQQRPQTLCFWPANASVTTLERADGRLRVAALGAEMASRVN